MRGKQKAGFVPRPRAYGRITSGTNAVQSSSFEQPLSDLGPKPSLAEEVGFEPTGKRSLPAVFKTAAINHSATPPIASVGGGQESNKVRSDSGSQANNAGGRTAALRTSLARPLGVLDGCYRSATDAGMLATQRESGQRTVALRGQTPEPVLPQYASLSKGTSTPRAGRGVTC
jgi:hypothetical protein